MSRTRGPGSEQKNYPLAERRTALWNDKHTDKKKGMDIFPYRELNPGRLGESQES